MNRKAENDLKNILDDKKSGSTEVLAKLNCFLQKNLSAVNISGSLITTLQKEFGQFEIIQKYLHQLEKAYKDPQRLKSFFNNFDSINKTNFDKLFNNSLPYLKDKYSFLTISNSKTIIEILKRLAATKNVNVTICESRPKFEGRLLARQLAKQKMKIDLITEAQSASYIKNCDCVLLGADIILKDGSVINKTGSYMLAILAHHFGKPVYIVSDKGKIRKEKSVKIHTGNPDEIWKTNLENLNIRNNYFEVISRDLISQIITN